MKKLNNRRKWMSWTLWISAGLMSGTALRRYFKAITHKKSRYIAADGKVYEVESNRFIPRKGKKLSNAELKSWIKDQG